MAKRLCDMTPDERDAAIKRAAQAFERELEATADQIGEILEDNAESETR